MTDATTGKKEIVLVGLTESVSLTDSVSEENSGSVYLTESISLNDNVRKDTVTELSESVMFDDSKCTGQE